MWTGAAFARKKEPAAPKSPPEAIKGKGRRGFKRPSPSPPSGAGVGEALRRRLAAKVGKGQAS
eukprot:4914717-Pyramimonas_sp.AAC.1